MIPKILLKVTFQLITIQFYFCHFDIIVICHSTWIWFMIIPE